MLTACSFLISPVGAIPFPVTKLRLRNAFRGGFPGSGTQEFICRTRYRCAVRFVRAVAAILVAVAVESGRNAQGIRTAKLTYVARRKIWKHTGLHYNLISSLKQSNSLCSTLVFIIISFDYTKLGYLIDLKKIN